MPVALTLEPAWCATGQRVPVTIGVTPPRGTPGSEVGPCADDQTGTVGKLFFGLIMVGFDNRDPPQLLCPVVRLGSSKSGPPEREPLQHDRIYRGEPRWHRLTLPRDTVASPPRQGDSPAMR